MLEPSEAGILPAAELESAKEGLTESQFQQKYECSFEAALHGLIFAMELTRALEQRRISRVPYDAQR